jgi:hypothetical protein
MAAGDKTMTNHLDQNRQIVAGEAEGEVLAFAEGISFWGGIDPDSGRIIDIHHPNHGQSVAGKILLMPTSRGSCSGSGVLLQLALDGNAPAALVFCEGEEVLTLGALVAGRVFGCPVPVARLGRAEHDALALAEGAVLAGGEIQFSGQSVPLVAVQAADLDLTDRDRAILAGVSGEAAQVAMEVLCLMAAAGGAEGLTDVTRGHIDGCILAHSANLIFAEKMADLGAKVAVPTTINAISVDRQNWPSQGVGAEFGQRASRLADAYVRMGAKPTFTCAPYLLPDAPREGEVIGWSESNAVIFANTVLGARTPKHPDYLDLFIAMTGRAPATGVYTDAGRRARVEIRVDAPQGLDDLFWPLLGWLVGRYAPDRIPLVTGLEALPASRDDLKAMCAAFGTTSGAPMLHVAGHTPEADRCRDPDASIVSLGRGDFRAAWEELNQGETKVDLVAIGSPHSSLEEVRRLVDLFGTRRCGPATQMIVTLGRDVLRAAVSEGLVARLQAAGVRLIPDLCWCSVTEPVFPPHARGLLTNSGKYAHYAHGLSGRHARLASLRDCVEAAVSGKAPLGPPDWLA